MKYIYIFLIIFLLTTRGIAEDYSFSKILYRNNIDIDSKSFKGWIRVFNSDTKIKDYNIHVSIEEREFMIKELKMRQKMIEKKYKRGIE